MSSRHNSPVRTLPASCAEWRIEAYLDQLCGPLAGDLSPGQRQALRREIFEHLLSRIEACQERGCSREAAVSEAIARFGGAADFAGEWRRDWRRIGLVHAFASVRQAAGVSLRCLVPALLSSGLLLLVLIAFAAPEQIFSGAFPPGSGPIWLLGGCVLLALPACAGFAVGLGASERPVWGFFTAMTGVTAAYVLVSRLILLRCPEQGLAFNETFLVLALAPILVTWLPIGCTAAALGSRHRLRRPPAGGTRNGAYHVF